MIEGRYAIQSLASQHSFVCCYQNQTLNVIWLVLHLNVDFMLLYDHFMKQVFNVRQFPFQYDTLDPRNRLHLPSSVHLANRFVIGKHELDLDYLSLEFRDFKACSNSYHYLIQRLQLQLIIGLVWLKLSQLQIILNFD